MLHSLKMSQNKHVCLVLDLVLRILPVMSTVSTKCINMLRQQSTLSNLLLLLTLASKTESWVKKKNSLHN